MHQTHQTDYISETDYIIELIQNITCIILINISHSAEMNLYRERSVRAVA